tara:strand:+ start:4215 stop:4466 length:252 start_codon:yes stop_codon:yes gene_type:complete
MGYETKDNTGSLFTNEGANSENRRPTKTGTCKVNGKLMRLSVWENQKSKDGNTTYDSLKFEEFKPKEERSQAVPSGVEDDIPF